MTQHQSQSSSSQSQSQSQSRGQDASLSKPAAPDATSPYKGPGDAENPADSPTHVEDKDGAKAMEQPYFSEAQSTLSAFAPVERQGDHSSQPEDPLPESLATRPTDQPASMNAEAQTGAEFATPSGTIRAGMAVVDSYGHTLGTISTVEGERMRLTSGDPHDDGVAFLPISLIDGIDGDRVLLSGRGDASFGMSAE